jgi:predicted TIM-barrel fold metal-dependent hydrolase
VTTRAGDGLGEYLVAFEEIPPSPGQTIFGFISGLFDRFPKLKIIIGHMGEALPYYMVRSDAFLAKSTSHLKRRVSEYFHEHLYVTTSGCFSLPPFLCALQVVGADRTLFSVDYPYDSNLSGRAFLDALPVSAEDLAKISHANAERLLKL